MCNVFYDFVYWYLVVVGVVWWLLVGFVLVFVLILLG